MTETDNVVPFPGRYKDGSPPRTLEEVAENVAAVKHYHIQESINTIVPIIFENLLMLGYEFDGEDPKQQKNIALLVESITSLLSQHYGMEHPLIELANSMFYEQEGVLRFANMVISSPQQKEEEKKVENES
jgi:hypothetical protein